MTEGLRYSDGTTIPLEPIDTFNSRVHDEQIDKMLDGVTLDGVDLSRKAFKHFSKMNMLDFIPDEMGLVGVPVFRGTRIYVEGTRFARPKA